MSSALAARSSARAQAILWLAQRGSAAVLAVCVIVHLAVIIYAVRGGLSAAEIFERTRGSVAWLGFYLLFVAAAAIHAPIGLRSILREWTTWRGSSLDLFVAALGVFLTVMGGRAAFAVFGWGAVFR